MCVAQAMTTELGKSCQSGKAVLALKKYISKCSLDNERLKDEIARDKQRGHFLSRFRCEHGKAAAPHTMPRRQSGCA